jgi:hypothetical protein
MKTEQELTDEIALEKDIFPKTYEYISFQIK